MKWSKEKRQEARDLFMTLKVAEKVAKVLDIPPNTVSRWCRDLIGDQRKITEQERKIKQAIKKQISENHVKQNVTKAKEKEDSRALYKQGFSYNKIVEKLGVSKSSVSLWCRDLIPTDRKTTKVQDRIEEVSQKQQERKAHFLAQQLLARDLYQHGKNCLQIAKEMNLSPTTISRWCHDLVKMRKADKGIFGHYVKPKKERPTTPRMRNGSQILTTDIVIEMRRDAKETGSKNLEYYAKKYGVSIASISAAISGRTFRYVDEIETPVPFRMITKRPPKVDVHQEAYLCVMQECLDLRRKDPAWWTYTELANHAEKKLGKAYKPTHIAVSLRKLDPTIVELEALHKPVSKPRIFIPRAKQNKPRKIMSASLLKLLADEERYERECAALLVDG